MPNPASAAKKTLSKCLLCEQMNEATGKKEMSPHVLQRSNGVQRFQCVTRVHKAQGTEGWRGGSKNIRASGGHDGLSMAPYVSQQLSFLVVALS